VPVQGIFTGTGFRADQRQRQAQAVQILNEMIQETFYPCRATTASRDYVLLPGLGLTGRYLKSLAADLSADANVWIAEWQPARSG
jgi:hypothetical protein